jgi:RNA polymerase sigma-70 factor (ECF subfamily)
MSALEQPAPMMLKAAQRGDASAFAWIFQTYQRPVYNYVCRTLGDRELAEDLTQEIFMRVHRSLPRFDGRCLFTSWLFQIAKNRLIDEHRGKDRRPPPELEFDDQLAAGAAAAEPTSDDRETVAAIWQAVAALDERRKSALLLRDVAGLTYLEIAEVLEIELSTVKWRIFKAREAIQEALADVGLSPAFPPKHATRVNQGVAAASTG